MTHSHEPQTTVVEDRSGMSVIAIIVLVLLVLFLIWLFAFSGWIGGNDEPQNVEIQNNEENTEINVPDGDNTTDPDTGTDTPAPGTSP